MIFCQNKKIDDLNDEWKVFLKKLNQDVNETNTVITTAAKDMTSDNPSVDNYEAGTAFMIGVFYRIALDLKAPSMSAWFGARATAICIDSIF